MHAAPPLSYDFLCDESPNSRAYLGSSLRCPARPSRQAATEKSRWPVRARRPLRVTWLYISPDTRSQKVDRVQIGREMVVAEHSGPWLASTPILIFKKRSQTRTRPEFGHDGLTPPISGWMEAAGMVIETTAERRPGADGRGSQSGVAGPDPRGPVNAAQSARLLYRRLVEFYPNSPLFLRRAGAPPTFSGSCRRLTPPRAPRPMSAIHRCATSWTRTN